MCGGVTYHWSNGLEQLKEGKDGDFALLNIRGSGHLSREIRQGEREVMRGKEDGSPS